MSLSDLLAATVELLLDSSGAPGDPGGFTTGGAGPALGGMGDGAGSGENDDRHGDEGNGEEDEGYSERDDHGEGEPRDPYAKDPSLEDLRRSADKAAEDMKDIFDEVIEFADRKVRGKSTADDEIVWDAVDKVGLPPSDAKEAAEYAVDIAEVGMRAAKTGREAKTSRDYDKHRPDQYRGEVQDEND